jgi:archaeoflavoprotein AfpA
VRKIRLAWGITGAGDFLAESLSIMQKVSRDFEVEVTALVSKNADMVVKRYRLWDDLKSSVEKVKLEKGANVPFVAGPLQIGYYSLFFVSPATANTVAKIAYGIADTLITNCVAQAIKGGTQVYIYPVDQELGSRETQIPGGDWITITTRRIDVENVERMRNMEGITVLKHPFEIEAIVASIAGKEEGNEKTAASTR